ncbi:hypothetical protein [Escherichia coli ISC41]|nr:hypothetical protein [Escherichia coli ISC41]
MKEIKIENQFCEKKRWFLGSKLWGNRLVYHKKRYQQC